MSEESKRVDTILASLTPFERIYLKSKLDISNQFRGMVRETELSKEQICEKWQISDEDYDKLHIGTHPFDLETIAHIEAKFNAFLLSKRQNRLIDFPKKTKDTKKYESNS